MLRKDPFVTGEHYHLFNRGIDKRNIFKSKGDFERFMMLLHVSNSGGEKNIRLDNLLNQQKKSFMQVLSMDKGEPLVSIGAWCLMENHFHILVKQETDGGITKFMKKLGTGYSMYFNIKYKRQGALFGGLFKSKLINEDSYLLKILSYIHLNPLEIKFPNWEDKNNFEGKKMKDFLKTYRYSSYQDYIEMDRKEKTILNRSVFPEYFKSKGEFEDFIDGYYVEI